MSGDQYQLFEALRAEEYEALKADIAKRGVMVPVELDEDGNILDGHHRVQIATELGIGYRTIKREGLSEQEKTEHVLKLNLLRRHLGPVSWANAFEKLAESRGIQLGTPGRSNEAKGVTVASLAEEIGVPLRTAQRRIKVKNDLAAHSDLSEQVDSGEMAPKRALRVVRERSSEQKRKETPLPDIPAAIDIRHCGVQDLEVEPGSVDLIFTDPPYPKDYLEVWDYLAGFASKALKPGGLLVAYSGQYHLIDVLNALAAELEYVWLGSLILNGPHNNVQWRKIRNRAKPLLFFSNGTYEPSNWIDDWFGSEQRSKENHEWEQSVGAANYYIEKLTAPGQTVCDPFLGSGTTAVSCLDLKRRFIGCDVDDEAIDKAKRRLAS